MSMIGNFRSASDTDIEALLAVPRRIERMLYGEYFSPPPKKRGLFSSLFKRDHASNAETDHSDNDWAPEIDGPEIYVDKAWHAIHFLLCEDVWDGPYPLNFIITGGTPIGDGDVGDGPARAYTSAEVIEITTALEQTRQS